MRLDHLTVPVSDYEAGKRFYLQALEPFGFSVLMDWHEKRRAYLGVAPQPSSLWVVESPGAGSLEVSLAVDDRQSVEAFHRAAVDAGGTRSTVRASGRSTRTTTSPPGSAIRTATCSKPYTAPASPRGRPPKSSFQNDHALAGCAGRVRG